MTYFTKRYHPPGTSPGTLIRHAKVQRTPLSITLTHYTDSEYGEKVLNKPEECAVCLRREGITWIHVQGDTEPDTMRASGACSVCISWQLKMFSTRVNGRSWRTTKSNSSLSWPTL